VAQGEGPEFSPSIEKKKKKEIPTTHNFTYTLIL
jgi:hypothetical protein